MTDITELAQLRKELSNPSIGSKDHLRKLSLSLIEELEAKNTEIEWTRKRISELEDAEQKLCSANVTLDARAEQAERERENWRTSFDNERLRADKLKAHIDEMTEEQTASINELSRIIQREIKAKREAEQRIAELESRTVTVKLPDLRQVVSGDRYVWSDGVFNYSQDVKAELTAKGIKWEVE
ncbi:TPA: hypothetical protein PGG59_004248 [Raoultella planticola]|nr:hypothetical protein [Raoultella planticola]